MFHRGLTKLLQLFKKKQAVVQHRKEKIMTPELTQEYYDTLQKEYQYVSACLQYSGAKFKLLTNQGLNPHMLQDVNNKLALRKTELELQLYFLRDYLSE